MTCGLQLNISGFDKMLHSCIAEKYSKGKERQPIPCHHTHTHPNTLHYKRELYSSA